jgi:heme A synthase
VAPTDALSGANPDDIDAVPNTTLYGATTAPVSAKCDCVPAAFMVLSDLNPWLVLGYFLLSMVLVANAVILHPRTGHDRLPAPRSGRRYRWAVTALAIAAVFAGNLVTGTGAHSGSRDGDVIERLPFNIPNIAHIHGVIVAGLILTVIATIWHLDRTETPHNEL